MTVNEVSEVALDWENLFRIIPSRYPPVGLFDEVASREDLDIIFEVESLTNDRLREEVGDLGLVPPQERIFGPGTTPVMAAFTHIGYASRFTDGRDYGVYYGAKVLATAIKETCYHREHFLKQTNEPDTDLEMRCYTNQVTLPLHDLRFDTFARLFLDDYTESQSFGRQMKYSGSNGLVYNSVRHNGGLCVAVFKPIALTLTVQCGHYLYQWRASSQSIEHVLEIRELPI